MVLVIFTQVCDPEIKTDRKKDAKKCRNTKGELQLLRFGASKNITPARCDKSL